jgi:hypothetical protein
MDVDRLKKIAGAVRTGGKGTVRRCVQIYLYANRAKGPDHQRTSILIFLHIIAISRPCAANRGSSWKGSGHHIADCVLLIWRQGQLCCGALILRRTTFCTNCAYVRSFCVASGCLPHGLVRGAACKLDPIFATPGRHTYVSWGIARILSNFVSVGCEPMKRIAWLAEQCLQPCRQCTAAALGDACISEIISEYPSYALHV